MTAGIEVESFSRVTWLFIYVAGGEAFLLLATCPVTLFSLTLLPHAE